MASQSLPKRFINKPQHVVRQLMQGVGVDARRVVILNPSQSHYVTVRSGLILKQETKKVAVISGGGSGHEPMAAGYVGKGMLAGAVAGEVFASPSTPAVVKLLEAVATHCRGILMLVMNYGGDQINFEAAKKELAATHPDVPVRLLLISDDVSRPDATDKRGIAGTVFVLKVAGAAAEAGCSLEEVETIAKNAMKRIASFGIALEPCGLPGKVKDASRLSNDQYELGMGIHGEKGAEKRKLDAQIRENLVDNAIGIACERVDSALSKMLIGACSDIAVMINNLGSVNQLEMGIIADAVYRFIYGDQAIVMNGNKIDVTFYVGTFMTSLDMNGASISCIALPKDGILRKHLEADTECSAWVKGMEVRSPKDSVYFEVWEGGVAIVPRIWGEEKIDCPTEKSVACSGSVDKIAREMIVGITDALLAEADTLERLDRAIGDGDMGDTVRLGCSQIQRDLSQGLYNGTENKAASLLLRVCKSVEVMGGSIGGLVRHFLEGAARVYDNWPAGWEEAVVGGTTDVVKFGGAQVGDRTCVDALLPFANALDEGEDMEFSLQCARRGMEETGKMTKAKFGRAKYLAASELEGNVDPGAYAVVVALEAMVKVLNSNNYIK